MESDEFEWQLQQEQEQKWKRDNGFIYTDPSDGTMYEWDPDQKAWFPRVDEDFIAAYQASYGISTSETHGTESSAQDEDQPAETTAAADEVSAVDENATKDNGAERSHDPKGGDSTSEEQAHQPQMLYRYQKMQMKRKAEQKTWFDIDPSKNTNVYVSGLPLDVTQEEFQEVMAKCGIIMVDEETEKPKIKLYLDEHGNPKGDGRCCYLKRESVDLAIQLLDESDVRGHKIHIEVATFTQKGEYKPIKKKKPQKKKKGKVQEKLLDWRPEKKFQQRKRNEQVVIFKNVFHPSEFEDDAMLINEIKDDLQSECSRFGEVKKVLIFDRHPEGVASLKFKDVENADACIKALNGRWFAKRQLEVVAWDGKTDYKIEETDMERVARLRKWQDFLEDDEEEEDEKKEDEKKEITDGVKEQPEKEHGVETKS